MSFRSQVEQILSDPVNLPPPFLDYLIQYAALNPVPVGAVNAPILSSTGLTGATKASRLVGSTDSGPPAQGVFQTGDVVPARDGHWWICVEAGSPGTWVDASITPIQDETDVNFTGDIHLFGDGNTMESGSVLTLKGGVSDPLTAPVLSYVSGGTLSISVGTTYVVGYTWVDGGGHESALSPTQTVTSDRVFSNMAISITIPSLPAGVTGFHIYAVLTSGTTKRQATPTYVSSETVSPTLMTGYNSGGAAPPGASTFPAGATALIKDANGNTLIGSDDSSIYANKITAATQTFTAIVRAPSYQDLLVSGAIGGSSITPDLSIANYYAYTWTKIVPGTLTVNAPLNPPSSSQSATLFLDITNASTPGNLMTYSWNGAYSSTVTTLPATLADSGTSNRMMFVWNGTNWLLYTLT